MYRVGQHQLADPVRAAVVPPLDRDRELAFRSGDQIVGRWCRLVRAPEAGSVELGGSAPAGPTATRPTMRRPRACTDPRPPRAPTAHANRAFARLDACRAASPVPPGSCGASSASSSRRGSAAHADRHRGTLDWTREHAARPPTTGRPSDRRESARSAAARASPGGVRRARVRRRDPRSDGIAGGPARHIVLGMPYVADPARYDSMPLPPMRPQRAAAAGDLARPVAQLRRRPAVDDAA